MRRQLQFLRDYKKESIIGPLFKMLEASFELIVPLIMANIIDVGIKNQDKAYTGSLPEFLRKDTRTAFSSSP